MRFRMPFVLVLLCISVAACNHAERGAAPSRSATTDSQSSVLELTAGQDGTYVWRGRSWLVEELVSALKSPMAYPYVTEVHLLSGSHAPSLQNLIEIGQLAGSLGIKAFYVRNGELKSINVVQ